MQKEHVAARWHSNDRSDTFSIDRMTVRAQTNWSVWVCFQCSHSLLKFVHCRIILQEIVNYCHVAIILLISTVLHIVLVAYVGVWNSCDFGHYEFQYPNPNILFQILNIRMSNYQYSATFTLLACIASKSRLCLRVGNKMKYHFGLTEWYNSLRPEELRYPKWYHGNCVN